MLYSTEETTALVNLVLEFKAVFALWAHKIQQWNANMHLSHKSGKMFPFRFVQKLSNPTNSYIRLGCCWTDELQFYKWQSYQNEIQSSPIWDLRWKYQTILAGNFKHLKQRSFPEENRVSLRWPCSDFVQWNVYVQNHHRRCQTKKKMWTKKKREIFTLVSLKYVSKMMWALIFDWHSTQSATSRKLENASSLWAQACFFKYKTAVAAFVQTLHQLREHGKQSIAIRFIS